MAEQLAGRLRESIRKSRIFSEELGSDVVEAALVLPLVLLFTFGVIQLCLFLYCFTGATYGSRAAVRFASTHGAASLSPCTAANLTAIVAPYTTTIPGGGVQVTSTWTPNNAVGSSILVKVSLSYATGIPVDQLGTLTVSTTAAGTILQ